MGKHYLKMSLIVLGFILASAGNGCVGGDPYNQNLKNQSSGVSNEDRYQSGVGGWSTYPGGSTTAPGGASTPGGTGSTGGSTHGASVIPSEEGSVAASGGGGNSSPAAPGVKAEVACDYYDYDMKKLMDWLADASSRKVPYCGIFKACTNCCGPESRFDLFYTKCAEPTPMNPATLGANSNSVCEDEGMNYLAGFIEAKKSVSIPCTTVKDCKNCCGPSSTLDRFHIECQR